MTKRIDLNTKAKNYEHDALDLETKALQEKLFAKCDIEKISYATIDGFDSIKTACKINLPCGREKRSVHCWTASDYRQLLAISFEEYNFIQDYDAICNYKENIVEAGVKVLSGAGGKKFLFFRLFGNDEFEETESPSIILTSQEEHNKVIFEISTPSKQFQTLSHNRYHLTVKISSPKIIQQDSTIKLLRKTSDAIFFQIDRLCHVALAVATFRNVSPLRTKSNQEDILSLLSFPKHEYDSAPTSLYWYARSAVGMPLLQFLAFYQVIEFYYPTYSQAEARRKIRTLLKDPSFREDRDADLGRLLTAIHITRSGGVGDERSQLRATLGECLEEDSLRQFIVDNSERKDFLTSKSKGLAESKIVLSSTNLRNDIAERIYDIRCKIVHTKTDAKNNEIDLLLPFSKEAEQLFHDIELVQFVAQQVLIAASTPFKF